MEEDAVFPITHGASAVWLVKPEWRGHRGNGTARTVYGAGDSIELLAPFSIEIALDEIFR